MTVKALEAHREFLQKLVSGLGRDDIAVGEVNEVDGKLVFTLAKGSFTHQAEVPLEIIADHEKARAAMMAIIPKISKPIEREHLKAAQRVP